MDGFDGSDLFSQLFGGGMGGLFGGGFGGGRRRGPRRGEDTVHNMRFVCPPFLSKSRADSYLLSPPLASTG